MNEELEKVCQYQLTKDNNILIYFWEKYGETIKKTCFKEIKNKFYSVPIEYDDLTGLVFLSMEKALYKFDTKQTKYSIVQALFVTAISSTRQHAVSLIGNGHKILNQSYSYDAFSNIDNFVDHVNPEGSWLENIFFDDQMKMLMERSNLLQKKQNRDILKLKAEGLTNKEVAKLLNVNAKKVSNVITYIKRKVSDFV